MAKLSSLKARKDENNREIRCLIVNDLTSGVISKHFDPQQFQAILDNIEDDYIVKVYAPTQEQKADVFKMLTTDVEGHNVQFQMSGEDVVFKLFRNFTDLEFDGEDEETMNDILENPNDLFLAVKSEMEKILFGIVQHYVETFKNMESNPTVVEGFKKQIVEEIKLKQDEEQRKKEKIANLKAQLEELGE